MSGLPSINLATDSLGLGAAYSSIFSAKGTEECGSKPTCVNLFSGCQEKNKAYTDCRMKALDNASKSIDAEARLAEVEAGTPKQNYTTYIVVAVILVLLILMAMSKKN